MSYPILKGFLIIPNKIHIIKPVLVLLSLYHEIIQESHASYYYEKFSKW